MNPKKDKIVFSVTVRIEKDNGGYRAFCPGLKGLHTSGDTENEVEENAKNAILAYLQSLIKHGDPIPLCVVHKEVRPKTNKHWSSKHLFVYNKELIELAN